MISIRVMAHESTFGMLLCKMLLIWVGVWTPIAYWIWSKLHMHHFIAKFNTLFENVIVSWEDLTRETHSGLFYSVPKSRECLSHTSIVSHNIVALPKTLDSENMSQRVTTFCSFMKCTQQALMLELCLNWSD